MQGRYGRKYRIKPRFYVIVLVTLSLLIWGVSSLAGLFQPALVEWGRLESNQEITAIILRDDHIVESTEYAKLTSVAAEGETVRQDDPVAMLYLTGYSPTDLENLIIQENKIKDYQENNILKDIVNKDLTSLNGKIDDKMAQISAKAAAGQTQSLLADERDLKDYMQQRKELMLQIITPDDMLNTYYQQKENLENKIAQTRKPVAAPAPGLVSFYLDGYEDILTPESIAHMTPVTIRELLKDLQSQSQSVKSDDVVEPGQPVCRVVDPKGWYAVVLMARGENTLVEGAPCDITFEGMREPVTTTVERVVTEGRNTLVVFRVPDGVRQMISLRLVNGRLGTDIAGYRVPVAYLQHVGEQAFIYVRTDTGAAHKIGVKVLGSDEQYAIISELSAQDNTIGGMELVAPPENEPAAEGTGSAQRTPDAEATSDAEKDTDGE